MDGRRDISIPLRNGALSGTLYQARDAESGVILLDGAGAVLPEIAELYDELAEYLQSSGLTILRVGYRDPRDLVNCTYDVLGALDAAHAWGVERAALIVWAFADSTVLQATAEGAVADVATAAVARSTGGERGPVRGIATIVSPPDTASKARRGTLRLVRGASHAAARQTPAAAPSLHEHVIEGRHLAMALEGEGDLRSVAAQLLSRLYLWSRQVLMGTAVPRSPGATTLSAWRAEAPAVQRERIGGLRQVLCGTRTLLGEDWEALLERMTARDPARATRARVALQTLESQGNASVFRQADHVWLLLDYQAREEWLQACTAVRSLVTAACRPASHPA